MSELRLPPMRVRRKVWNLGRIAARFLSAFGEIEAQREPWAQYWDDHNAAALRSDGPLWIILGDSVGQGIGASEPDKGFVPQVVDRLRHATGEPWRAVNLAMTGARVSHVTGEQLPAMTRSALMPVVTTCMIGFNDLLGGTSSSAIRRGIDDLIDQVPQGTLIGRVGGSRFRRRSEIFAARLEQGEQDAKITLFHPYNWTDAGSVLARDRIHLNDRGYELLAETIFGVMVANGVLD